MDSSSQDKNLPASQQRLQEARRDGQVARSTDLGHLAVLGAGSVGLLLLLPPLFEHLQRAIARHYAFDALAVQRPGAMLDRLADMVQIGLVASVAFALLVGATALVCAVAAGGWTTSLKPVMPDFARISPLSGIKNLLSKRQLANVVKLCVLTAILGWVAWAYLASSLGAVATLVLQPSASAIAQLSGWLTSGVGLLLAVVLVAALVDVPLQAFFHKSKLKMSHQEVKQEHKTSEGSPEIKGRQRQRQREMAQRASVAAVPKADFVVMNPTHFAVALAYDSTAMGAPRVVSKGADLLALRIRDIARQHAVPVLESPMLARALYAHAEIDEAIPQQLYTAVAQVLAYVYKLRAALRGELPMPGVMPQPHVPPELDPLDARFTGTHAMRSRSQAAAEAGADA